jgi:hypothetical protein
MAAPIRADSGNVVAALSVAGPAHRIARKTLLQWSRTLVEAADAASQRLGWQPSPAGSTRKSRPERARERIVEAETHASDG